MADDDITSIEELGQLGGEVIKYSRDRGKTWEYAKLWRGQDTSREFTGPLGGTGFDAELEVSPSGVHVAIGLTDRMFQQGMMVRRTTPEEIEGKKFSHERSQA